MNLNFHWVDCVSLVLYSAGATESIIWFSLIATYVDYFEKLTPFTTIAGNADFEQFPSKWLFNRFKSWNEAKPKSIFGNATFIIKLDGNQFTQHSLLRFSYVSQHSHIYYICLLCIIITIIKYNEENKDQLQNFYTWTNSMYVQCLNTEYYAEN